MAFDNTLTPIRLASILIAILVVMAVMIKQGWLKKYNGLIKEKNKINVSIPKVKKNPMKAHFVF
ncbi:hypothetical protein [Legionella septentrionalis]|uniref:Uncharacterized protein n=2 Tax=Legionella septentrionalis TaxID=2498109 RepID=A0A3S0XF37_9GAMM|nr:hypothetical protein [Legionella septentrionalis]RUQ81021.1 hypothetical protein EKM59_10915 [Legionella septentrionalis]RUQ99343.1 hypothetical protein ELY11_04795 [Legionella septentrionalis]